MKNLKFMLMISMIHLKKNVKIIIVNNNLDYIVLLKTDIIKKPQTITKQALQQLIKLTKVLLLKEKMLLIIPRKKNKKKE